MRHGNVFINYQTFNLMEHRGVGGIIVRAISSARSNNADRRLLAFHRANLHRGSMCADNIAVIKIIAIRVRNIESILHLACRVVGRHIQSIKVVELVFNIRAFGNRETHLPEDGHHLFINF